MEPAGEPLEAPAGDDAAILLIFKTDLRHLDLIWQEAIAVALAVAFPVLFFPYSRTIWIALDLVFHPPDRIPDRQLWGRQLPQSETFLS